MTIRHAGGLLGAACRLGRARPAGVLPALFVLVLLAAGVAPARADFQAGAEAYARGDYRAAFEEWQPYAEQNDPRALYNLGQMYRLGVGVEKDMAKAEQYYRRAAGQGHIGAAANLASLLYNRNPRQGQEAVVFWQKAARGGDVKSQYLLGVQYLNGEFVARDYVQAYAWLSLAVKAGLPQASQALAMARSYMDASAIAQAGKLAPTLVVQAPAAASVAPAMPAVRPASPPRDRSDGVVDHPVDYLDTSTLAVISPDVVREPLIAVLEDEAAARAAPPAPPPPVAAAAPARPAPVADNGDTEYRALFASFKSRAEAQALRDRLMKRHGRLLTGGVEVETVHGDRTSYRVRSGTLTSEAAARSICAGVRPSGIACQPSKSTRVAVAVKSSADAQPAPVAAPPAAQAVAAVAPAAVSGRQWRVQIGAGRTEEEARLRWSRLMGSNADLLDAAELYIFKADLGEKGVFYRVQIGGFRDRPAAVGFCEKLKTRNVQCFVAAVTP
jgi:hypothetical protein